MISRLSPIILFVYNRLWHTQQTIESLQKNELATESEIFIYSDGSKKEQVKEDVTEVRAYLKTLDGFKSITIIERDKNWGLANSIIDGVTEIVNKFGKVIVLEDDIVTSPFFLRFMNEGLEFYHDDPKIMSISGYTLPPTCMRFPPHFLEDIYLNYRNSSWGWATWADRWRLVDWSIADYYQFIAEPEKQKLFNRGGDDMTEMLNAQMEGKIDSWAIRFSYAHFKYCKYSLCPKCSYVNNIGHDGTGMNCGKTNIFLNDLSQAKQNFNFIKEIQINEEVMQEFRKFSRKKCLFIRVINKLLDFI